VQVGIFSYYQNINMLKNCIHSLMSTLQEESDVEILVINDNPNIDLVSQLSAISYPLPLRIIQLPANRGHSGACAVGVDNSEGKYLIFLDSDIVVSSDWFSELKKTFFGHPNCGAASSTILDFSSNQIVYFGMELFKSETIKPFQGATRRNTYVFDRLSQIVTSGCMLISREAYLKSGGFDETFYNSCNDLDLSMKLNSVGYENYISANSIVYHRGNVSGEIRFASHIYARSLFFQKWGKVIDSNNCNSLSVLQEIYTQQTASNGDYLIIDFSSSIFSESYLNCIYKAKSLTPVDKYRIRNNSEKIIITDYLLWDICQLNVPILYFVDDYRSIMNNYLWFNLRENRNDIVADRNGNIISPQV